MLRFIPVAWKAKWFCAVSTWKYEAIRKLLISTDISFEEAKRLIEENWWASK